MTKIYGHRGSSAYYPENSMRAFKEAIAEGCDGIELDVHMTKDGEIIVIHDETIDRTTSGSGKIEEMTLEEVRMANIGMKFTDRERYDASWNTEAVPTLAEVLLLLQPHGLEVNIEVKNYIVPYVGIEARLLEVIEAVGYDLDKIIFSSFHLPTLMRLKEVNPQSKRAYLSMFPVPLPEDYMQTFDLESIHIGKEVLLKYPDMFQPVMSRLRVWTVNDEADMTQLLSMGVEAIMTDYPTRAMKLKDISVKTKKVSSL